MIYVDIDRHLSPEVSAWLREAEQPTDKAALLREAVQWWLEKEYESGRIAPNPYATRGYGTGERLYKAAHEPHDAARPGA